MVSASKASLAVKAGDLRRVEEMLREGLHPDQSTKMGWTILHVAAKAGKAEIVGRLLDHGAKADIQTDMRQTALDVAIANHQTAVVRLLKERGCRTGAECSLHAAAMAGELKWVKKHLAAGVDINSKDRGELPICIALGRCRWDVARLLLRKGADIRKRQDDGNMAIHEAACHGADDALLQKLVNAGADVNAVGAWQMTPLCWAARGRQEDVVRFLLQEGANMAYRAKDGTCPVREALQAGCTDLAYELIDKGAKCSLHQAVQCGHIAKARELLQEGADFNEREDGFLDSPLGVAIWNDSVEMVQVLLDHGADPNEQDPIHQGREGPFGGSTPLHDAVRKGSSKMVKLLLSKGADPDIQDADRLSPIELARRRDQTHLVKVMETHVEKAVISESVDQLYTVAKVAELLSVEEEFVRGLLATGKLRQVRLDPTMVRIPASSLRGYIAKLVR